jgi:hypothetical protein
MRESNIYYYCGEPADSIDHVIPRNALARIAVVDPYDIHNRVLVVDSCRECNCLIGGKWFDSLQERKDYLKTKLRKRYQKFIDLPDWTDHELSVLGYALADLIRKGMARKRKVKQRLSW